MGWMCGINGELENPDGKLWLLHQTSEMCSINGDPKYASGKTSHFCSSLDFVEQVDRLDLCAASMVEKQAISGLCSFYGKTVAVRAPSYARGPLHKEPI